MKGITRLAVVGSTLAALAAIGGARSADTGTTAPLHGGVVNATRNHVFETVVSDDGMRVYLYTEERAPAMVDKASGQAMIRLPDGKSMVVHLVREVPDSTEAAIYFCPMHPEVVRDKPGKCEPCRGMVLYLQDRLYGKVDLAGVKPQELSATIRIGGLPGREKKATFTPAFRTPDRKAE